MSYANMDGVPTQTAGTSEILASDWNTYVRDNFDSIKFGHIVCTSSTRPTSVAEGTMIYETDTNQVLVYDGSSWFAVHDLDNNAGLPTTITTANIGDSQVTAAKVATSLKNVVSAVKSDTSAISLASGAESGAVSGLSVTITPSAASSKILVMANIVMEETFGGTQAFLTRGGTKISIGNADGIRSRVSTYGGVTGTYGVVYLDSPNTTSAVTYDWRVKCASGATRTIYVNRSTDDLNNAVYPRTASNITVMEVPA